MSKRKKVLPWTRTDRQLNNLLADMEYYGIVGALGSDVRRLYDMTLDHNTNKCRGRHCSQCAIMPSFKSHLWKQGLVQDSKIKHLLNTDAEAAVPSYIDVSSIPMSNTTKCTGDRSCPVCPEFVKRDLSHRHNTIELKSTRNRSGLKSGGYIRPESSSPHTAW